MSERVTKVGVSIPTALYEAVERVRRRRGSTRSAVVGEALDLWLLRQREAAQVKQYEAGYRRKPETRREIAGAAAAAVRLLATEDW